MKRKRVASVDEAARPAKRRHGTLESLLRALRAHPQDSKSNLPEEKKQHHDDDDADADDADADDDDGGKVDGKEGEGNGGRFWVYVLESCASPHYSYVGFTVDRARRLRQHNGELASGGAKYTKMHRPWRMVMSITAAPSPGDDWWTKNAALQLEWRIKHVSKGRGKSRRRRAKMGNLQMRRWKTLRIVNRPAVERRINDVLWLLHNRRKWTSNAPEWKPGRQLILHIDPSIHSKELQDFLPSCSFWQPTISISPSQ